MPSPGIEYRSLLRGVLYDLKMSNSTEEAINKLEVSMEQEDIDFVEHKIKNIKAAETLSGKK